MNDGNRPDDQNGIRPVERARPTLKTIAFMTGLGITTVSRALKDAPDIGADTKERVRLVARQIGYQPNRAGVRLRTGKTNVIALVLSIEEEMMGFTNHIVFGISEVLTGTPYHLVVTPHASARDPLVPINYILDTGSADGVIISRTEPNDARVRLMTERGMPFATHGRTSMGILHPFHDYDNESFAREAVARLARRGRGRIAILQPPPSLTYSSHSARGFRDAIAGHGLAALPFDTVTVESPLNDVRDATAVMMSGPNPPDGIVSMSGSCTVAMVAGLEAAGKRLGRDVDLVSKQNSDLLRWIRPDIMVANEDVRAAGTELARAVLASIRGEDPSSLQTLYQPVFFGE
nr:LacI family transcriptional regulator [uncultured Gellertiella sp.]